MPNSVQRAGAPRRQEKEKGEAKKEMRPIWQRQMRKHSDMGHRIPSWDPNPGTGTAVAASQDSVQKGQPQLLIKAHQYLGCLFHSGKGVRVRQCRNWKFFYAFLQVTEENFWCWSSTQNEVAPELWSDEL